MKNTAIYPAALEHRRWEPGKTVNYDNRNVFL